MRHLTLPLAVLVVGLAGCTPEQPEPVAAPAAEKPRIDVVPEKTARQEYEEGPKYDYSDLGNPPKTEAPQKPASSEN